MAVRSLLPNQIEVAHGWNPVSALPVSWASDFELIASKVINVKSDTRLQVKAAGDGIKDDTASVRDALRIATSLGGATLYFPAGTYRLSTLASSNRGNPIRVPSRVILRGANPLTSVLYLSERNSLAETDWVGTWGGIDLRDASFVGMVNIGIYNDNPNQKSNAVVWNSGSAAAVSKIFFCNIVAHLNNGKGFRLENINSLLVQNSHFDSTAIEPAGNGPAYIVGNTNVDVLTNRFTYNFGRVFIYNNTNLTFSGNTLRRDALHRDMDEKTAMESGGIEISFDNNLRVLSNNFRTINAPPGQNADGEAIMSQHSTAQDVFDAGSATSTTKTTLTDANALWGTVTQKRFAEYPGTVIAITSGPATGQVREIQSIETGQKKITLKTPWTRSPGAGALYSIFRWSLQNAIIAQNTLVDNPNGIVIWDGCYRCLIEKNTLTNSHGILLRAADTISRDREYTYSETRRSHELAVDTKILDNVVTDNAGLRPPSIVLDIEAFAPDFYRGMGQYRIQVGRNTINPYPKNPSLVYNAEEIPQAGFFPCVLFGPAPVKDSQAIAFQNINSWDNSISRHISLVSRFASYAASQDCVTPRRPADVSPDAEISAALEPNIGSAVPSMADAAPSALEVKLKQRHRIGRWITFFLASFLLTLVGHSYAQRALAIIGGVSLGLMLEWVMHVMRSQGAISGEIRDDCYGTIGGLTVAAAFWLGKRTNLISKPRLRARY